MIDEVLDALGIALSARPATRPTTSSARSPTGAAARSTSSPATATCSSWSTTTARSASSTRRGRREPRVVDEAAVAAKYGIPAGRTPTSPPCAATPATACPACRGGDKTAAALITRFGSLEALLRAAEEGDELTSGQRAKLSAARDYLRVAPEVVQVARDVPIPATDLTLPVKPRDPEALAALAGRYGLGSPLGRLSAVLEAAS